MNRRSFITKALAGLAVVPLIGRLVQANPVKVQEDVWRWWEPGPPVKTDLFAYDYALNQWTPPEYAIARGPISRVVRITISREAGERLSVNDQIVVNGERYEIAALEYGESTVTLALMPPVEPLTYKRMGGSL